jgi:hypothetical protein
VETLEYTLELNIRVDFKRLKTFFCDLIMSEEQKVSGDNPANSEEQTNQSHAEGEQQQIAQPTEPGQQQQQESGIQTLFNTLMRMILIYMIIQWFKGSAFLSFIQRRKQRCRYRS